MEQSHAKVSGFGARRVAGCLLGVAICCAFFFGKAYFALAEPAASLKPISQRELYPPAGEVVLEGCGPKVLQVKAGCPAGTFQELRAIEWKQGCSLYVVNLSEFRCPVVLARAVSGFDELEVRLKKNLLVSFVGQILDSQESDGGWGDPLSTAQYLWYLSFFNDSYREERDRGFSWLKDQRDNEEKCWGVPCRPGYNAKILFYLVQAGFNESHRVVHDGLLWLESKQNYIGEEKWNVSINADEEEGSCLFYQGSTSSQVSLDEHGEAQVAFAPKYGERILFDCGSRTSVTVFDEKKEVVFEGSGSSSENISFLISPACWGDEKWSSCDVEATLFAVMNPLLDKKHKDEAKTYLKGLLREGAVGGAYLLSNNSLRDSAWYLRYVDPSKEVGEWLIFEQNNDGSWGEGSWEERAIMTVRVIDALRVLSSELKAVSEAIHDGLRWLEQERPVEGWGSIEADALTFLALKASSLLTLQASPPVVELKEDEQIVEITSFLEGSGALSDVVRSGALFSKTLQGRVAMSVAGEQEGVVKVVLAKNKTEDGVDTGFFFLDNKTGHALIVPIIVRNEPFIFFKPPEKVLLFEGGGLVEVDVEKSSSLFLCKLNETVLKRLEEQGVSVRPESFAVQERKKITFNISTRLKEAASFPLGISFRCTTGDDEFGDVLGAMNFSVLYFDTFPFSAPDRVTILFGGKKTLKIKNNLPIPASLKVSVASEEENLLRVEKNVVALPAQSSALVVVSAAQRAKDDEAGGVEGKNASGEDKAVEKAKRNDVKKGVLVLSVSGVEKRVAVVVREGKGFSSWIVVLVGGVALAGASLFAVRRTLPGVLRRSRKKRAGGEGRGKDDERGEGGVVPAPAKTRHADVRRKALQVAFAVNKVLAKNEEELVEKLKEKGFDEKEIRASLEEERRKGLLWGKKEGASLSK